MSEARSRISRKTGKPTRIMALPTTDVNLYLHVRIAHLQMMLRKAADQQGPPKVATTQFGWEVKGCISSSCVDSGLPAPQGLTDVINCGCKSEGKARSTESCNCHKNNVLCTVYCACSAASGYCKPYTKRDDAHKNEDEPAEHESE